MAADSVPMDEANFFKAYAKAREAAMVKRNVLSSWGVTGNQLVSRAKALRHLEIQEDRPDDNPKRAPEQAPYFGSDDTPKSSRHIRDLRLNRTPKMRTQYDVMAKGFEGQQQILTMYTMEIAGLEEELARLKRGKTRKAMPFPISVS
ncbi:transposase [Ceratocystis lukuohia]|uniref:Transposase n=1 Tax=Ceratocystis lukuohia TaxID=2019550 RepID=A0ABR4MHD5_9PEZI